MKKISDFLKSNILIVFGALLLVYFLNFLSGSGSDIALGIIAIVMAAYYIAIGILLVVMGSKLSASLQKVFSIISVSLFAVFMFVEFLITTIGMGRAMGPTGWVVKILSMIVSLAFVVVFILSKVSGNMIPARVTYLFAVLFALSLLLNILFTPAGTPNVLGNIDILLVVIFGIYSFYLFNSIDTNGNAPAAASQE